MSSTKQMREIFSEDWDDMNDRERMSSAGEMSVYFVELLAQVASMQGDTAQARKLLKAAMQLEAILRDSGSKSFVPYDGADPRKLH